MQFGNIDIYYFSGTGNTLLVVNAMREVFARAGSTVQLFPIEKADPGNLNLENTIGLAFTVAAQSTYPLVWRFLENMPTATGTRVFMVDTLGMFSGGIVGPLKKMFEQKGYQPIGAKEIIMPMNFMCTSINENKNKKVIEKGLEMARQYANQILRGESKWKRIPVLSDIMCAMSRSKFTWKFVRRWITFSVDPSKCKKCELCVKLCPVDNIEVNEHHEYGGHCEFCMRCFSFCPNQAISLNQPGRFKPYRAVSAKDLLA